jgi:hypothetical protein
MNKEFYWFNGECVTANGHNETCHDDLQCQTLTQHTVCNNLSLICDCTDDKYWNRTRCGNN